MEEIEEGVMCVAVINADLYETLHLPVNGDKVVRQRRAAPRPDNFTEEQREKLGGIVTSLSLFFKSMLSLMW